MNNAGSFHHGEFEALTPEEMQQQINVNLLGTLMVCQQAIRHFPAQGGSIINLSALNSKNSTPGSVLWAATKGAVDTLTQGLARELGAKNIRVNALAPGMILTEGLLAAKRMSPQLKAQLLAATPLGRFGLPEDVAQVALFLASEESAYVSGERVMISGGA